MAEFKCDNSSSATDGSFAVASACACTLKQSSQQENENGQVASPQVEQKQGQEGDANTGGSVFEPSNIQSQNQDLQQATDAGFAMGARYVINYLTVVLAALDHLL